MHSGGGLVAEEEAARTTAVRMHALLRERRRCIPLTAHNYVTNKYRFSVALFNSEAPKLAKPAKPPKRPNGNQKQAKGSRKELRRCDETDNRLCGRGGCIGAMPLSFSTEAGLR